MTFYNPSEHCARIFCIKYIIDWPFGIMPSFIFLTWKSTWLWSACFSRLLRVGLTKGQLISKANCQPVNSSKKRKNEFIFTTIRRVFVHFLEEIDDPQKPFRNQLTFNQSQGKPSNDSELRNSRFVRFNQEIRIQNCHWWKQLLISLSITFQDLPQVSYLSSANNFFKLFESENF